ncbi:membrane-associated protein, putative [Bodo saltans]|uniref:Membrane-associated protein, putative n=1 Tax=Bodo saltans TaxID=75058 RepID=A0A0S4IK80_BODSA|nr:membrane-associated protein, putative [Bodo saltans]|eukprot:CUF02866.1 membrane-associated protein, putative [Bodo saltans]
MPLTISVRTFLAIVTAVVGITAAAIAFAPVYTSALSSVEDVVTNLRREIGARLQVNVVQYFASPQLRISSLMTSAVLGAMNTSDKWSMIPYFGMNSIQSRITTYCGFEDGTYLSVSITNQPPNVVNAFYSYGPNASKGLRFQYNMTTRTNVTTLPAPTAYTYNPTVRPWYKPLLAAQAWSQVYLDNSGKNSVLTVGGPFTNSTGDKWGAFAMDFQTTVILSYLQNQTVGKTGRVFLLDRVSHGFLGGNWNVSSAVNVSGVVRMAELRDVAASDALVFRMFNALGLQFVENCTAPCRADLGSGNDALYVDVLAITDSYGLDMRLVVLLPAKDFMDKIDHNSKITIGSTVAAVVALLLIAVIAGHVALSPLSRLEERLYAAASLTDDNSDDDLSTCDFLSEIVNIESAFNTLRAELARIKSFVPQSVLQKMEDGDDADAIEERSFSQSETSLATSKANARRNSVAHSALLASGSQSDAHTVAQSKRSSEALRVRERRGAAVLNVSSGLATRQVTLLVANVIGFHEASADSSTACSSMHSKYLDIICAASSKNRGVVDHFSGDRVFISFNASNNVATHVTRCAAAICGIEDGVRKLSANDKMTVRLGAATGRVLAGNMGNNTIKRFSMVGKTVNQSMVLLQLAKMWNVPNVVSSATMETMEFEYNVEAVGIAVLPGSEKGAKRMVVGSVLGAKAKGDADEWMYELNAGGKLETDLATLKAAYQQLLDLPNATEQVASKLNTIETQSLVGLMRLRAILKTPEAPLGALYESTL